MKLLTKKSLYHLLLVVGSTLVINMPAYAGHAGQGPSGGVGGATFDDWSAFNEKTSRIYVRSGAWIDSIHIQVANTANPAITRFMPHRGGFGGILNPVAVLAGNEFVTRVSGYFNGRYISQLRIRTSAGQTFTFGNPVGAPFSYQKPSGNRFSGFLGRSGSYLDAVGVNWRP